MQKGLPAESFGKILYGSLEEPRKKEYERCLKEK